MSLREKEILIRKSKVYGTLKVLTAALRTVKENSLEDDIPFEELSEMENKIESWSNKVYAEMAGEI